MVARACSFHQGLTARRRDQGNIMTGDRRFGCTGGAGSSCGGAIVQVDRPPNAFGGDVRWLRLCRLAFGIELATGRVRRLADKGLLDPPYASTKRGGYKFTQAEARFALLLRAGRDCFGQHC